MKQPVKKTTPSVNKSKSSKGSNKKYTKPRKEFIKSSNASELDGSGLEAHFRTNFLDKLGVDYVQQYEAKDIGRFYDFMLPDQNILIEIDGDYFHKNPMIYRTAINGTQRRNIRIDEVKNKWALLHSFCLIRIWEYDIRHNPKEVMEALIKRIGSQNEVVALNESKKNGSFFKKKK